MSRLIETIRYEDGKFFNLHYHEERMQRAFTELFHVSASHGLEDRLMKFKRPEQGLFKCRIVYDQQSEMVEFTPYIQREVRSLKIVEGEGWDYDFKYEDRSKLNLAFVGRGTCDDILIVRNGWVTDTSQANIAFRKSGQWITPSTTLLRGTMRESLIDRGILKVAEIRQEDILKFDGFRLINAMLQFESDVQPIKQIEF